MRSKDYPPLDEQIAEFGVYKIFGGRYTKGLVKEFFVENKTEYNHDICQIHHYIKEQEYYKHPERYEGEQKLILLPKQLHADLHSAMSDARFYNKWKIERDLLLYRHRKVENEEI